MDTVNQDDLLWVGQLGESPSSADSNKLTIAAFDLDSTLIQPKLNEKGKRRKFAKDIDDWEFLYPNILEELTQAQNDGYYIIIFTNQLNIGKGKLSIEDFITKLNNIFGESGLNLQVYASLNKGLMRKPSIGMWLALKSNLRQGLKINKGDSFYVGDAAGRKKDFSDSDYKFALNVGIQFFTPEWFQPNHQPQQPHQLSKPVHLLQEIESDEPPPLPVLPEKSIIIMVGSPASGKSSFSRQLSAHMNYTVINQDTLKTKAKCKKQTIKELEEGKGVIIDNTNRNRETRAEYIKIAKDYDIPVFCIYLKRTKDQVFWLNNLRLVLNQLLDVDDYGKKVSDIVVHTYFKYFEEPKKSEGYEEMIIIDKMHTFFHNKIHRKIYNMYL